MKLFILLALASLFITSCSNVDSKISSRFTSQQCNFMPQVAVAALEPGMQSVSASNSNGLFEVCDSMYTVDPSFDQKITLAKSTGAFTWSIIIAILSAVCLVLGVYKSLNQRTSGDYLFLVFFFLAILLGMGSASIIDWAHSKQSDISKSEYVTEMNAHGNLSEFWDQNLLK